MIFVDTNVIIDVLQNDPVWADWSITNLANARAAGDVIINAMVIAELSRDHASLDSLSRAIEPIGAVVDPIDEEVAFLAGQRFVAARRQRGDSLSAHPLPDFFIAAHALQRNASVMTRDPRLFRRYFPELTLITPENDHG